MRLITTNRIGWAPLFFLSAALYSSHLFTLLSPLPLLWFAFALSDSSGRAWRIVLAVAVNAALVLLLQGNLNAWFYFLTVGTLVFSLPFALDRFRSVNAAATVSFLALIAAFAVFLGVDSVVHRRDSFAEAAQVFMSTVDQSLATLSPESQRAWLGEQTPEEWRQRFYQELPWMLGASLLLLVAVNLGLVIRLNPGGLRARYGFQGGLFSRWRAPDWLLWPTILAGFLALLGEGRYAIVGMNALKLALVVYAIQGLSVLSSLFSAWKLKRIWRWIAYGLVASVMTPIILTIGFFDQWFDFRAKFRQT